ncbi:MAG: YihY/virulence factor BrkB family protein [Rhodothermales bacterium]|nr:YihY/virulence factor BrkB family protein [Rhodothermales bacterium]
MASFRSIGRTFGAYVTGLWRYLNTDPVFLWAQAVAFKALVAVVPLAAMALGLFGPTIARVILNLVPDLQGGPFIEFLESLQRSGESLTWLGAGGLLYVTVTLFSTLRSVLEGVFDDRAEHNRSVIRGYLADVRMTIQIGIFFLLSLSLSFGLQALNLSSPDFVATIGLDSLWIESGWRRMLQVLGLVVPAILSGAVFFQLYRFVPASRPSSRSALAGAVVAAVLWELAKVAFAIYASRVGLTSRYSGSEGGLGDYFGVIIAFVFWAYYSGVVFIMGAYVTIIHRSRNEVLSEEPHQTL